MKLSLFSLEHQLCSIPKLLRFGLYPLMRQSRRVVVAYFCFCPRGLFFEEVVHVEEESSPPGVIGEVPREDVHAIQFVHAGKLALLAAARVGGRATASVVASEGFAGIELKLGQVALLEGRTRLAERPRFDLDAAAGKNRMGRHLLDHAKHGELRRCDWCDPPRVLFQKRVLLSSFVLFTFLSNVNGSVATSNRAGAGAEPFVVSPVLLSSPER